MHGRLLAVTSLSCVLAAHFLATVSSQVPFDTPLDRLAGGARGLLQDGSGTGINCPGCAPNACSSAGVCSTCADGSVPGADGVCPVQAPPGQNAPPPAPPPAPPLLSFRLHSYFKDGVVLARGKSLNVRGYAPAEGYKITVKLLDPSSGATLAKGSGTADSKMRFTAALGTLDPALAAGGPYQLQARSDKGVVRTVDDVWVGEVWLVSGQSNMILSLADIALTQQQPYADRATNDIAAAAASPAATIRMFQVPAAKSPVAVDDLPQNGAFKRGLRYGQANGVSGQWTLADGAAAQTDAAAGFYLAQQLQQYLPKAGSKVIPVGIVQAAYAGASIQQLVPPDVLPTVTSLSPTNRADPNANLFNAMVAPLYGISMSGVVYYQGESDAGLTLESPVWSSYGALLGKLLSAWRSTLQQPDLFFEIVQLPNYNSTYKSGPVPPKTGLNHWAAVRQMQQQVVDADAPNSDLVCTIDIGNPTNPHPNNKQDLAYRLAAQIATRNGADLVTSGPTYKSHVFTADGGALLTFANAADALILGRKASGLRQLNRVPSNSPVLCFDLLSANGTWLPTVGKLVLPPPPPTPPLPPPGPPPPAPLAPTARRRLLAHPTKKRPTKKRPTKKRPTKKRPTKKRPTKKRPTKKRPTKKRPTKKRPTKKKPPPPHPRPPPRPPAPPPPSPPPVERLAQLVLAAPGALDPNTGQPPVDPATGQALPPPPVDTPAGLRYSYADAPAKCNLFNTGNLPALPFVVQS